MPGRAGRTQEGKCFRLVTEDDFLLGSGTPSSIHINDSSLPAVGLEDSSSSSSSSNNRGGGVDGGASGGYFVDFSPAEMQRTDITGAVLQLKALGIDDVLHFDFLSPPPADSLVYALELLYSLHAIDDCGETYSNWRRNGGDATGAASVERVAALL